MNYSLREKCSRDGAPQRPISWTDTRRRLDDDRRRLRALLRASGSNLSLIGAFSAAYLCVWLHRISHYYYTNRCVCLAGVFWQLNMLLTGADISPAADIQGGLVIPHPAGVSITAIAGRNLTVMALSGIGCGMSEHRPDRLARAVPVLGDNVYLSYHAGIHGPVKIGNGAHISPGCIVTTDVDAHTTIAGPPVRWRRLTPWMKSGPRHRACTAGENRSTGDES